MKPGGLSRGRGIKVYKSLSKILNFFEGKDNPWIIMKYIENPLILRTLGCVRKVNNFHQILNFSLISDNGCWLLIGNHWRYGFSKNVTWGLQLKTTKKAKSTTSLLISPTTPLPNIQNLTKPRRLKETCGMSISLMIISRWVYQNPLNFIGHHWKRHVFW